MHTNVNSIVDRVLTSNKKVIDIRECIITENNQNDETVVTITIDFSGKPIVFEEGGDGFVDAMVKGMVNYFSEDYKSLKNFSLSRYEVRAKIKTNSQIHSDARVDVELGIKTPNSKEILFKETDVSVVRASTKIVRNAIQFMINCEEAVKVIHSCLREAQKRGRMDVVEQYTNDLIELVKLTSYEEVLNE